MSKTDYSFVQIMKRKIIFIIIAIIVLLTIPFSDHIFFLSWMTLDYLRTTESCPPPAIFGATIKPFTLITNKGKMYPGDEYVEMVGDSTWGRTAGLIFAGKNGATFIVVYAVDDPIKGKSQSMCRVFSPVESQ